MHLLRIEFFDVHDSVFENDSADYDVFENFQRVEFLFVYDKSQKNNIFFRNLKNVTRHDDKSENNRDNEATTTRFEMFIELQNFD